MGQANPHPSRDTPHTDSAKAGTGIAAAEPIPAALANSPDYEIVREISRGGMGVVYLARNRRMDRLEGLKVVKAALLERAGALERFEREMRAAARLSHPNIVTAYSSPPLEGLLAFAMEYVDGIDLYQLVKTRGPLPVANACYYVYQTAQGLQHAHERQMVHRDIKPNNLMLTRDGKKQVIKILDFGLAKATSENPIDAGLTGEGQVLGTPHYMAPEQISHASQADIRADIYSLGCTLYYLLSGAPPFKDKVRIFEILQSHHTAVAPLLNEVRTDIPAELAAIVARMMSKDTAHRYQQPVEVAQALTPYFKPGIKPIPSGSARFATPSPDQAPPETASSKAAEVTRLQSRLPGTRGERKRRPLHIWLGLAAAAGCLGFLGLWAGGAFTGRAKTTERDDEIVKAEPTTSVPALNRPSPVAKEERTGSDTQGQNLAQPVDVTANDEPSRKEPVAQPETADPITPVEPAVSDPPVETVESNSPGAGTTTPEFQPADLLKAARNKYAADLKKAERTLDAHFDREIDGLARVRMKPEDRVHLIAALKAEKGAFETRKLIPWSAPMRGHVLAYLKELMLADATITKAHDRHISAALKARDDSAVEKLRAELRTAAPRRLLGSWICTGVTFKGSWTWKLYSDGTFNLGGASPSPGDEWLWALDSQWLLLKTRHAKDPKVQVIDRCTIATDGAIFTGENSKKDRFAGRIDRSGN